MLSEHCPEMNTPGGHQTPGGRIHPMRKFPSLASVQTAHTVQTMASLGFLAPGYGYVPRKKKLEKPFGPSFKYNLKSFLIKKVINVC